MFTLTRFLAAPALALALSLGAPGLALADGDAVLQSAVAADSLSKNKQTKAGLYITAAEAAEVLAARDDVILIDVRSPEETMFVGYATAADANIPFKVVDPAHAFVAKKSTYKMNENADFKAAVKAFVEAKDPAAVIVMCRSGSRSAGAVNAMLEAGIETPIYNMIDGFEGDKNDAGRREVNGWKQAGAEWTYDVREGLLVTAN